MRALILFAFASMLAGCAGTVETRLANAGALTDAGQFFQLQEGNIGQTAEHDMARDLLIAALAQRNLQQQDNAPILLQFTLSQRPSSLAVTKGEGEGAKIVSPARKKRLLGGCGDWDYRMTMRLTRIADGAMLYSGEAAEYHCKASLKDALPAMVAALVRDMENPPGERILQRKGLK